MLLKTDQQRAGQKPAFPSLENTSILQCIFCLYIIVIYNYYPQKGENTTENNEINYLMASAS